MGIRCTRSAGALAGLLAVALTASAGAAEPPLSLTEAVRQTLAVNLDLAAQRQALAADREQIGIARSALLPQIGTGAQAQLLDDDRSDGARGNTSEGSVTFSAGFSQVLYDESSWAGYAIQKHVYDSQRSQLESFRLSVIQDAARAFLELERAQTLERIQQENREVTLQNVETSKARIAAGYSGERDVLRWQIQLSQNDTSMVQAQTLALSNRFELNRVRNQPHEDPISLAPARIDEYGFVYARESIATALSSPEADRAMRDFMVRAGLARSPVLAQIDAAIAAQERQLTASHRAFWVPSLSLGAGVNHLVARDRANGSSSDFNETEWGVRAGLSFPVFAGGAKFAGLRQSHDTLSSLRIQRRSEGQTIGESIRVAFAQASGSYASLGYAREQEVTSRKNYDLVNQSYVAGVSSILDLLDAQTQLLDAQIGVANATYGFLEDLMAAEQEIAFFPFLEPESEVAELLDALERQLRDQP